MSQVRQVIIVSVVPLDGSRVRVKDIGRLGEMVHSG